MSATTAEAPCACPIIARYCDRHDLRTSRDYGECPACHDFTLDYEPANTNPLDAPHDTYPAGVHCPCGFCDDKLD